MTATPSQPTPSQRLTQIAAQLKKGQEPETVSVRELLGWFGAQRRGSGIVWWIRHHLQRAKLATQPDFEGTWLDGQIKFVPIAENAPNASDATGIAGAGSAASASTRTPADPTYRIGKLRSANTPPLAVAPNQTITEAITLMLANDFSQLPVMTGERDVKGMVSWNSIGSRLALGVQCNEVRHCMDPAHEISADASLFDAIDDIVTHEYVLIRDSTNKISGIVTTSDLSVQFRQLAEPFLLLGEIENHVRQMIERGRFTKEQLAECKDPNDANRTVERVSDLAFGEYIRLLESQNSWPQVQLGIDRKIFVGALERVRQIRNDVMHFDPDGITEDDLISLRKFTGFLQRLAISALRPTHKKQ